MKNFIEVQEYGGVQRLLNINHIVQVTKSTLDNTCTICMAIPEGVTDCKQSYKVGMVWIHAEEPYAQVKAMIKEASK